MGMMDTAVTRRTERDYVRRVVQPAVAQSRRVMGLEVSLLPLCHKRRRLATALTPTVRTHEDRITLIDLEEACTRSAGAVDGKIGHVVGEHHPEQVEDVVRRPVAHDVVFERFEIDLRRNTALDTLQIVAYRDQELEKMLLIFTRPACESLA